MAKMPFMQFYPLDWLRDTRQLTHESRAVWIDILAIAWNEPQRGVYKRREDMAAQELGLEFCGLSQCEGDVICPFHRVMAQLSYVAEVIWCNQNVSIISRRMVKEETARNNNVENVRRYRRNRNVIDLSGKVRPKKLEVRSQKSETIPPPPPLGASSPPLPGIPEKQKLFQRPLPQEVTDYAKSIGFALDGQHFVDYYTSNGWKIGRNPMKDWKATVRTWKRNQTGGNQNVGTNRSGQSHVKLTADAERVKAYAD